MVSLLFSSNAFSVEDDRIHLATRIMELTGVNDRLAKIIDTFNKIGYGPALINDDKNEERKKFLQIKINKSALEDFYRMNLIEFMSEIEMNGYLKFLESDLGKKVRSIDDNVSKKTNINFKIYISEKIAEANKL